MKNHCFHFAGTKTFNKPQAYLDLQGFASYLPKSAKQTGFTYLTIWEEYRKNTSWLWIHAVQATYAKSICRSARLILHGADHGRKLLIDYAGDRLLLTHRETGETQVAELPIAVLVGSGYTYVEASEGQQSIFSEQCAAKPGVYWRCT